MSGKNLGGERLGHAVIRSKHEISEWKHANSPPEFLIGAYNLGRKRNA